MLGLGGNAGTRGEMLGLSAVFCPAWKQNVAMQEPVPVSSRETESHSS